VIEAIDVPVASVVSVVIEAIEVVEASIPSVVRSLAAALRQCKAVEKWVFT
jgi:hypothetical protein